MHFMKEGILENSHTLTSLPYLFNVKVNGLTGLIWQVFHC
jgi:hypothetical protein